MSFTTTTKETGGKVDLEYGSYRSAIRSFSVYVDKSNSVQAAIAIANSETPQYLDLFDNTSNLYCSTKTINVSEFSKEAHVIKVDCDYIPAHQIEGQYIFQTRGMVQVEESSNDRNGTLVVVDYVYPETSETIYQTGTFQAAFPYAEIVATGISATPSPKTVAGNWLAYCNSTACWGWEAYQILCTEAAYEPWDLKASVPKYKFRFTFSCKPRKPGAFMPVGHEVIVAFRGDDGNIPVDATLGNGIEIVYPYQTVDYTSLFPLAGRS